MRGDFASIKKKFHFEDMENGVVSEVYNNFLHHPLSLKVVVFLAIFGVTLIVYLGWTCSRILKVQQKRHNHDGPKEEKLSKINYLWAILSHSKMDINLNKRNICETRATLDDLRAELLRLNARLDILQNVNAPEQIVPPAYNETFENVV